jgi:UDP-glucuronate 4-epimerase
MAHRAEVSPWEHGMTILVTGAAGFIGFHTAQTLLARGEAVVGIDNLNGYYSVALKRARLALLCEHKNFRLLELDIADHEAVVRLASELKDIRVIVHLAAQPGVRYSLQNPAAYVASNLAGQVAMLEAARRMGRLEHFVYASSSSVYGRSAPLPFSIGDRADRPASLYAATKRADELITHAYCDMYKLPATGLRFFTVYGPWGRPDMATYSFTEAIFAGRPLRVFNDGRMERDFTYIDDIVDGVLASIGRVPMEQDGVRHALYNLGHHRPEKLLRFIEVLEGAIGRKAVLQMEPMQPGDVPATFADITESRRDLGFEPKTPIEVGLPLFVDWFRRYQGLG